MAIPRRTALFWRAYRALELRPVLQQPAERVRGAANLRARVLRLPGTSAITGRPDPSVTVTTDSFTHPDGATIPLRIYRPDGAGPRPVVLNFHGGGFVSGDPHQSEWWCAAVAGGADAVVVSVDYRLAPEHPFPVPVEDCYAATEWVADHGAELGVDPARLAVMGDSAGGNMAAVVSLMSRDRRGPSIALQVLVYPSVHLGAEFPSHRENAVAPVLTLRDVGNAWRLYLDGADPDQAYASPLLADHRGLPPALIQTARHDPLRDEGAAYAAALRRAGVRVRATEYVDAVHGFISLPNVTVGARQAVAEAVSELRAAFDR